MRILLINPSYSEPIFEDGSHTAIIPNFPIGLGYVAAYVREYSNHEVHVLDAGKCDEPHLSDDGESMVYGLKPGEIRKRIKDINPDVIGISGMYTRHAINIHLSAALAKEICPHTPVIVGGSHASLLPEVVIQDNNIDFVCIGEGESTFLEFCNTLPHSDGIFKLPGLCYKKDGKIMINEPRTPIEDLDSIPFPARDLFDFEFYTKHIGNENYIMRQPWGYLITSRGCPFHCLFCNVRFVWTRKWRYRTAENIVSEMKLMKGKYGIREFAFMDDCASADKRVFMHLLDEIIRAKLDIKFTFPTGLAFKTLDKEVIDKLFKAGCYRLTFGIESGNPDVREQIRKTWPLEKASQLIAYANKIGMWTINTNIIGFIDETREQMEDTFAFNAGSGVDLATFYLLHTHPAAEIYEQFSAAGLIPDIRKPEDGNDLARFYHDIYPFISDTPQRNRHFSSEQLEAIQGHFYRRFLKHRFKSILCHPIHLMRKIRNIESALYAVRLGMTYLGMMKYLQFRKITKDTTRRLFMTHHRNGAPYHGPLSFGKTSS